MALNGVVLRRGMHNSPQVQVMQRELNATLEMIRARECRTVDDGPFKSITVDGDFGPNTEASIRRIQEYINEHNLATPALVVDGVFGPNTLRGMRALVAAGPNSLLSPIQASYSPADAPSPEPRGDDLTIRVSDIVPEGQFDTVLAACREWVPGLTERGLRRALEQSVENINELHPEMRASVALGMRHLYADGHPTLVVDAHRSGREQNRAFNNGRSGARAGESFHNYGLSVDMVHILPNGDPDYRMGRRFGARAEQSANIIRQEMINVIGLAPTRFAGDLGHFQIVAGDNPEDFLAWNGYNWRDRSLHREGVYIDIEDRSVIPGGVRGATAALLAERNPQPPAQTRPTAPQHVEPDEDLPRPLQLIAAVVSGDRDRAEQIFRSILP